MGDQRERGKERAILRANPVLGTDKFKEHHVRPSLPNNETKGE